MSERNGDKSRFGRERRKKILRRKNTQELRQRLSQPGPALTPRQRRQAARQDRAS